MDRRTAAVSALVAGWLLIAGGTAGAVVALGRDGSSSAQASATPGPSPSLAASTSASSSPSPTFSSSSSSTTPSPSTTTPTPTFTGKVVNGVHTGDIRFFLMPVPSDASVIGAPEGTTVTKDQVAGMYGNSSEVGKILDELGFKDGAVRDYQTGDAKYHVIARVLRFSSAANAKLWFLGDSPASDWKEFGVPGYSDAKAYDIAPPKGLTEERLRAVFYRGDVAIEVAVIGQAPVDHAVLFDRLGKQITRLDTGT